MKKFSAGQTNKTGADVCALLLWLTQILGEESPGDEVLVPRGTGGEEDAFVRKRGPEAPSGAHFVQAAGRKQIWFKPGFPFVGGNGCFRASEISPLIFSIINKLRNNKSLKTSQNGGAIAHTRNTGRRI